MRVKTSASFFHQNSNSFVIAVSFALKPFCASKIISVIAKSNNIPVIVVKFLKENNKYINKEVIKIKKKPKGILFRIKSLFTKNNFIICDYGHDIPYLIRELKKNVFINEFNLVTKERIYSLVNSNIKNNIDLKLSEIYEYFVEKIHEIIKIISIGFFEIIEPFIFMWVYKILPEYIKIFEYYNKFFNTCRQIIILTSTTNLAYYHLAVFDAAKSKQKKIITYQEGAGYGSPDVKVYDYSEYRNCDYFISYGELSSYLKKKKIMNTCKILEAGSLRLKKLKCDLHNNMDLKYKILYCTSYNPVRNHFPYNFSFSNYSYKLQKDISNLLESLNVKAAVQVAPNNAFNVIDKYILNNKSLFNKLDVIQNKKFVSVLPITEAVIIDFPSTTLMEALITEKPIFFYYSNWLSHIDDDALFLLKKRVCVIESLEKLKQNLFKYFRYNLYEADITNKEYFEKYCLNEKNKKCEELLLNFFTKFNKNIEK